MSFSQLLGNEQLKKNLRARENLHFTIEELAQIDAVLQ